MSRLLVRVSRVGHAYGSFPVLKNIDLELHAGRLMLLMGPNGAGKSTLLRIMAGITEPSVGRVEWKVRVGRTAFMGHETFIYRELTAWENLDFWRRLYGLNQRRRTLKGLLDRVGLLPFRHERAGTFSRGMAQKLSLARVLLLEPQLVLLDEPATGLDQNARRILQREVASLVDAGAGVVWVSHDPERDLALAHLAATLEQGRLSVRSANEERLQPEQSC